MLVRVLMSVVLSLAVAGCATAQTGSAPATAEEIEGGIPKYIKEETPEQRRARVGEVDPGLNPDPKTIFHRMGKEWTIERHDKQWAAYDVPKGFVRPRANLNFAYEIYQENEKYVWVWVKTVEQMMADVEERERKRNKPKFTPEQIEYVEGLKEEFTEVMPPAAGKTVRFEESSEGLPSSGSWRHSAALADMNGDGHIDIIAPPERGMRGIRPVIFLGDGTGTKWTAWQAAHWPYRMEYGTVVAGDFNADGKPDLAFGMHLRGARVLLNNGDGKFIDASEGMTDPFPTRRVAAADVDGDRDLDLLAIYEGPSPGQSLKTAKVRAYINEGRATKWRVVDATAEGDSLGGDWFAVGNFNTDKFPDFVTSSNMFHGSDTVHRSTGAADWENVRKDDPLLIPFYSFYHAVATGRFSSRRLDDALLAYERIFPKMEGVAKPPIGQVVGIDRISFAGEKPKRTPVVRFAGTRPITGMGPADFDGDGKLDVLFTRYEPREAVLLLGDHNGGFKRAQIEGLPLMDNSNYDVTVGDVNGDDRPDVVVLYESNADSSFGKQNGSIRVFLNRGVVR